MNKLAKCFNRAEEYVAIGATLIGIGMIFINVITRYVLNSPIAWADEYSLIVLAWGIIIGFSIDLREDSHINMDIVYTTVKSKGFRKFMDFFVLVCLLIYSVFITYYGGQAIMLQRKTGRVYPITEFPKWIAYLIIVIVGAVMVIRCICLLIAFFKKKEASANGKED